jgi:hypothetical protein
MSAEKNQYDYLNGATIANKLEQSQINKFHTKGGTGFAAEEANALHDALHGHKVEQVGRNNALNGADRITDGVAIQTKYFSTAKATINAAFDAEGLYRYNDMLLEVPSDQYEESLKLMGEQIKQGKVPGFSDPNDASAIVKKGQVSYQQAKNIAKAGNIDSITFDMKNQCVVSGYAFAISFGINFAKQKWDGKSADQALKDCTFLALHSSANSFITGVLTAQILRTKAAAIGVVISRDGVRFVAQTSIGKQAIEKIAQASLGKAVYGAAATNHVAKLLRSNVITSVITTVVISTPDFYHALFSKRISWSQFGKNLTVNGAGAAGGAAGWMAGAAAGGAIGSVVPVLGTTVGAVVGGFVGALAGGAGASFGSKYALDALVDDDSVEMLRLLQEQYLPELASDYLLSEQEVEQLIGCLGEKINDEFLRDMYQSDDKKAVVYAAFEPICTEIIAKRPKVSLPDEATVRALLAQLSDELINEGIIADEAIADLIAEEQDEDLSDETQSDDDSGASSLVKSR